MSISVFASEYILSEKPKYAVECVDEFSLDENANLELGRSQAKYVYKEMIGKNVHIDMLKGMDEQVGKRRNESLDKIFHWLMEKAAPNSVLKEALDGCDFVCRRGPLSRIAASPYSKSGDFDEGQRLIASKYKGIYFMREFGDKSEEEKNEKMNEFQSKMCYLGRKFEQIMTSNDPNKAPNGDEVVDPNAEFNGMFKATLTTKNRPLHILCSAEIDGILKGGGEKDEFVELKTQIRRMGVGRNFINKAVKWYFQSHLIGIKRFVVGYHDNFIMNKVDFFTLDQLLEVCGGANRCPWNVDICLNFLHAFLEKVKSELDEIDEGTILVVERPKFGNEFHFTPIEKDNEDYEKYKVISDEFNAHGWKKEEKE